ncbi:MAG: hypothetical protein EOP45_08770 [Sphingobacteriaceae bacterium]|nr:MAG: hypothetical protein EOP45_08770 [Sphingobacteriaceae bacterium]
MPRRMDAALNDFPKDKVMISVLEKTLKSFREDLIDSDLPLLVDKYIELYEDACIKSGVTLANSILLRLVKDNVIKYLDEKEAEMI